MTVTHTVQWLNSSGVWEKGLLEGLVVKRDGGEGNLEQSHTIHTLFVDIDICATLLTKLSETVVLLLKPPPLSPFDPRGPLLMGGPLLIEGPLLIGGPLAGEGNTGVDELLWNEFTLFGAPRLKLLSPTKRKKNK